MYLIKEQLPTYCTDLPFKKRDPIKLQKAIDDIKKKLVSLELKSYDKLLETEYKELCYMNDNFNTCKKRSQ